MILKFKSKNFTSINTLILIKNIDINKIVVLPQVAPFSSTRMKFQDSVLDS